MNNKIPTAEDIATKIFPADEESGFSFQHFNKTHQSLIKKAMIEFAKIHCEAQLKAILENAKIIKSVNFGWEKIDKDSIINAYDLNQIK